MEGLPTVCIEALSSGIPSICFDVGGCKEIIQDGVTGYVVPKGDVNAFVDRTLKAIEHNGFKDKCVQTARELYDWSVITSKIEDVYNCLL